MASPYFTISQASRATGGAFSRADVRAAIRLQCVRAYNGTTHWTSRRRVKMVDRQEWLRFAFGTGPLPQDDPNDPMGLRPRFPDTEIVWQ